MSQGGANASPSLPRSTQSVIDQALRENRGGLILCYLLAAGAGSSGIFTLVWGCVHGYSITALAGAIMSFICWPAMHYARSIRHTNMMIRLLEIPLANARTAKEAAQALREAFLAALPVKKE
jgi:hypothetical protein